MTKPGRRQGTPTQVREGIMQRTENARRRAGLSQEEMAAALSDYSGRHVSADTYRKWEKTAVIPHDLLIAFCEIARADIYELLTGTPFTLGGRTPGRSNFQKAS